MMFEGVIFDLDGTLADTLEDLADALNRTLTPRGSRFTTRHGQEDGRQRDTAAGHRLAASRARTEETIARCLDGFVADYGEHCLVKTRLYDGVPELVRALCRATPSSWPSSRTRPTQLTQRIVDALIGAGAFGVVFGAQPGIPLKPDPAGALLVSARLGIAPEKIAYLGDSRVDMLTATAAGMVPIGVSWGFRTADELAESGARMVLDHPLDLLAARG